MRAPYTYLEFFAGGGMARLGLGDHWIPLLANDIDSQKCAAYRMNFGSDELIEGDIAALDPQALPATAVDLMWGSFPCQDLSLAGARGGINAKRSGVFFDFWRHAQTLIASGRTPRIIALENVTGLLTSHEGRDFAVIVNLLADHGYRVTATIIDAKQFTPQSRPRLFIMAFAKDVKITKRSGAAKVCDIQPTDHFSQVARKAWFPLACEPQANSRRNHRLSDIIDWKADTWHDAEKTVQLINMMAPHQRKRIDALIASKAKRCGAAFRRTRQENGRSVQRLEARFDGVAGCLRTPAGGSSRQLIIAVENGGVRTRLLSAREAARLMGLPEDYRLPQSETAALKLCGDGICVPVVQWLAETVFEPALASVSQHDIAAA